MQKGKKVKPTPPPSFQELITLENIGKFIKARRTEQGLSTNDCAMLCNISAYTLNKIENGFEGVRLNTLLQIMEALGMEMSMKDWNSDE
ncbi:MAG: Transcriptional regulator [uncultured Sulfurovum sp.]|uniref:Transcriptional regulator n=1 Tax=uncultured Sulfurovum sp. TaxID=269237 RepID=A0A6S6ST15_9BACT|nr:MAG: Transcriptional regulator [uncultured Sulfurovum sp.]